jgi:ABC-type microcin C transport system duplicated ATPase subunit YejF
MADLAGPSAYLPQPPPLVGREREQAMLSDALAAALAGRGALVPIGGEAGIGKTTLTEARLPVAPAQGTLSLVGRSCHRAETQLNGAAGCGGIRRGGA